MSALKRMEHGLKLPYLWELEVLAFAERHSLHPPPSWLLLLAALSSSPKSSLPRCKVSLTPREMLLSLPGSTAMTKSLHQVQPPFARRLGTLAPLIQGTYDALMLAASNPSTRARLLAVVSKEAGAWLTALPISSLGLRMDVEVVRIAVELRLGVALCVPHCCQHCGSDVDEMGTHGLPCRFSKGRHFRLAAINDTIKRSLNAAKIPCLLEPNGLYRPDGKRPDGATMVPWRGGKMLVWDATCPDTLAPSYSSLATREAGAVAEEAERRKKAKYSHLERSHCFIPVAVETFGVFGPEARYLVKDLGRRIAHATLKPLSTHYLRQRISVAVQRGNAVAILSSISTTDGKPDDS